MADALIPDEVKTYIEGLLTDAGMTALDDTMKDEMVKELFVRVDNYLASVLVQQLPQENLEVFIKMNEENKSREEIESFLKEKIPNVQDVFTKAFADFRTMYLGNVAVARSTEPQKEAEKN